MVGPVKVIWMVSATVALFVASGPGGLAYGGEPARRTPGSNTAAQVTTELQKTELQKIEALIEQGKFDEAETEGRRLLAELEVSGESDPTVVAEVLDVLVKAVWRGGEERAADARELASRALALRERSYGKEDPRLVPTLDTLANLTRQAGSLQDVQPLFERVLSILEKAYGPQSLEVAPALNQLALLQVDLGHYAEGKPHYERAIAIRENQQGPDHPDLVPLIYDLSRLLRRMGDYDTALSLSYRALDISRKAPEPNQYHIALILNHLAILKEHSGDYANSRLLYDQALELAKQSLGPEAPFVASILNNKGYLLKEMGDDAAAKESYLRALAISEVSWGPKDPYTATIHKNLGDLLLQTGDYEGAQSRYQQALDIRIAHFQRVHPVVATTLKALGDLHAELGEYDRARALYKESIAIHEKTLGPDHPDLVFSLNGLAALEEKEGNYPVARTLSERALAIREKALGPEHPLVAINLITQARLLAQTGERKAALVAALRAEKVARDHVRLTISTLAEREALRYDSVRISGFSLALSLIDEGRLPEAQQRVWDVLLQSRALVLDEMATRKRVAAMADSPQMTDLLEKHVLASRRLANLRVKGIESDSPDHYRLQLQEARTEVEAAERALGRESLAFRRGLSNEQLTLPDVASHLPPHSALVSLILHDRFDLSGEAPDAKPVPWYLAFVVNKGQADPQVISLGAAEELEAIASTCLAEASQGAIKGDLPPTDAEARYHEACSRLRRRLWDPIASSLEGVERVLLVPDGIAQLVNFYALPIGDSQYLIDTGPEIHYLSSERDLLATGRPGPSGKGLLVLGGPDFNEKTLFASLKTKSGAGPDLIARASNRPAGYRAALSSCGPFMNISFPPLPGSIQETEEIIKLWNRFEAPAGTSEPSPRHQPEPIVRLLKKDATESAFKKEATGKSHLHLATHGFFFGGQCVVAPGRLRGIGGLTPDEEQKFPPQVTADTMHLAGLVLAGANHRAAATGDEEDGILTAQEITSLDLSGVEWAVLSACDTGLGEVRAGEGVFGLRRAFQIAGARTLVMSLWAVADETARDWMKALYTARWGEKLETSAAVRKASLRLLRQRREAGVSTHPFHWAGFVAVGDWR